MPRLAVWLIRSSLLHLAAGFALGAAILWQKGPGGLLWAWRGLTLHIHVVLIGWMVQLTLGVAYWILPRFVERQGDTPMTQVRGRQPLAWASFALLNASTAFAALGSAGWEWGSAGAGILADAAAISFLAHAWPRVKPFLTSA